MTSRSKVVRALTAAAAISSVVFAGAGHAATPVSAKLVDTAGDANFVNDNGVVAIPQIDNVVLPAGNQAYADVQSVTWTQTLDKKGKVSGFTVTTKLGASVTTIPPGVIVAYRMLMSSHNCGKFGVNWYSQNVDQPTSPLAQSAVRDNCKGPNTWTTTGLPKPVSFNAAKDTIIWTVPLKVLPAAVEHGETLKGMSFEVKFFTKHPTGCLPVDVPSLYPDFQGGGTCYTAYGMYDKGANATATFPLS
jgi:hypothetical protein